MAFPRILFACAGHKQPKAVWDRSTETNRELMIKNYRFGNHFNIRSNFLGFDKANKGVVEAKHFRRYELWKITIFYCELYFLYLIDIKPISLRVCRGEGGPKK